MDIVLGKDGYGQPEHWIELKSYAAAGLGVPSRYKLAEERRGGDFIAWDFSQTQKGNTSLHRQFSLDRAAAQLGMAWLTKKEADTDAISQQQSVGSYEWRFQAFTVKNRKSGNLSKSPLLGTAGTPDSLRKLVENAPHGRSAGDNRQDIRSTSFGGAGASSKMVLVTPQEILKDMAKAGFGLAAEAVEEVVETD